MIEVNELAEDTRVVASTTSGSRYELVAQGGRKNWTVLLAHTSSHQVKASERVGMVPLESASFRVLGATIKDGRLGIAIRAYPLNWAGTPEDFQERRKAGFWTSPLVNEHEVAEWLSGLT